MIIVTDIYERRMKSNAVTTELRYKVLRAGDSVNYFDLKKHWFKEHIANIRLSNNWLSYNLITWTPVRAKLWETEKYDRMKETLNHYGGGQYL